MNHQGAHVVQHPPGTTIGPVVRAGQFFFALIAIILLVTFKAHFAPTWSLIVASIAQCTWSFLIALVDVYAIKYQIPIGGPKANCIFSVVDGIISAAIFAGICLSAGMVDLFYKSGRCNTAGWQCEMVIVALLFASAGWLCASVCFLYHIKLVAQH